MRRAPFPILAAAAALLVGLPAAGQTTVPFATLTGGVGVHYNDNGQGEFDDNIAYFKARFSLANPNGALLLFDGTPLPGTGGALSWAGLFEAVPGQFGFDLVLEAPTSDGSVPTPTLVAVDNGDNTLAGAIPAGPVDWAINGYAGPGGAGPADPSNGPINSLFRGGNGDGSSITLTIGPVQQNGNLFTVDFTLELVSDGLIHWYTLGQPDSPVSNFELTGRFFASGTLTYDAAGPGETSTNLIDFYGGSVTLEAEVICGDRFVSGSGDDFPAGIPNNCRNAGAPCRTLQRTVEISCPGDAIHVDPGLYAESVVIDRPVKLIATSPATEANAGNTAAQAVIDGSGAVDTVFVADGVDGVVIRGFEITNPTHAGANSGPAGIRVQSDDAGGATVDVVIEDNVVHAVSDPARTQAQFGEVGILAFNIGAGSAIRGNTIFDLADAEPPASTGESPGSGRAQGILVKSSNGTAGGVLIEDNVIHDVQDVGIRWNSVSGVPSATIRGNTIRNVGSPGTGFLSGIAIDHLGGGTVEDNAIRDVTGGFGLGIQVSGASLVRGNDLRNIAGGNGGAPTPFPGAAILVNTDGATLQDNFIDGNALGIVVGSGVAAGTTATNNCIQGNPGGGLVNASAATVDATNNWWGSPSGPGGEGPGTGDAILNAGGGSITAVPFLTAPACAEFAELRLSRARLSANRSTNPAAPRGRIVVKGDFEVDLATGSFDPSAGVAVRVTDGLALDTDALPTPPGFAASDCQVRVHAPTGVPNRIFCRTPDRSQRLVIRALRPYVPGGMQAYRFVLSLVRLDIPAPFGAPIALELREAGGIFLGTIDTNCRSTVSSLTCRN